MVILFLFGYPLIFGWWSMLLLPITLAIFGLLNRWQTRHVVSRLDIHPGNSPRGFVGYLFVYQVLTSAAALRGYGQYLFGRERRWTWRRRRAAAARRRSAGRRKRPTARADYSP